jgi:hypothetical protein
MIILDRSIEHRIIELLVEHGGAYAGTERMCLEAPASKPGLLRAVRRCVRHNRIKVRRGGGSGRRTVYRLTAKGLKYVRSK